VKCGLLLLSLFPTTNQVSQVTSNLIEAIVSIQRLSVFLQADELQSDARKIRNRQFLTFGDEVCILSTQLPDMWPMWVLQILSIKNGDFSWTKQSVEPTLEGIDLTVNKGELVGIFGRVGAGKVLLLESIRLPLSDSLQTSLLSAIIGEMTRREGEVILSGSISYAPQDPW
jgi:ATP-binding cassette subfamily C (CFTR/MRP) protein 1